MFFEQEFKIFYDNGKVDIVDDLWDYILSNFGNIGSFAEKIKFDFNTNISFYEWDYYYNRNTEYFKPVKSIYVYTKNNIMVSPQLIIDEYIKLIRKYRKRYTRKYIKRHTTQNKKRTSLIHGTARYFSLVVREDGEPLLRGRHTYQPYIWDLKEYNKNRRSTGWKEQKRKKQYK